MCYYSFYCPSKDAVLPCGRCELCVNRRVNSWAFRLLQEIRVCDNVSWLTLTYADKHLTYGGDALPTLVKRDVQLFMKRLRKKLSPSQADNLYDRERTRCKFFLVGEYGGRFGRPHYHLALFNCSIDLVQPAWKMGNVHYGKLEPGSIFYTMKYMYKRHYVKFKPDHFQPEFMLCSKGIGESYLTPQMLSWHRADLEERGYCNIYNRKTAMPRYYKDKLYTNEQRLQLSRAQENKRYLEELKNYVNGSDSWLRGRSSNAIESQKQILKTLKKLNHL